MTPNHDGIEDKASAVNLEDDDAQYLSCQGECSECGTFCCRGLALTRLREAETLRGELEEAKRDVALRNAEQQLRESRFIERTWRDGKVERERDEARMALRACQKHHDASSALAESRKANAEGLAKELVAARADVAMLAEALRDVGRVLGRCADGRYVYVAEEMANIARAALARLKGPTT